MRRYLITAYTKRNALGCSYMQTKKWVITTGTVTYAIKGRDVLRRNGFSAKIERKSSPSGSAGCGYTVVTSGERDKILQILNDAGVKILKTEGMKA